MRWRTPEWLLITTGLARSASCHLLNVLPRLTKRPRLQLRLIRIWQKDMPLWVRQYFVATLHGPAQNNNSYAPSNSIPIIRQPASGTRCNSPWKAASVSRCVRQTLQEIWIHSLLFRVFVSSGVRTSHRDLRKHGVLERLLLSPNQTTC